MLTIVAMLIGFVGGLLTLRITAPNRDLYAMLEDAERQAWTDGYNTGEAYGFNEGVAEAKRQCQATHDGIREAAADKAAAANEAKWERDLLPSMITFAKAEVRAELLQKQLDEKQAAQAKLVSEVEDTYW